MTFPRLEFDAWCKKFDKADGMAKDWLIKSWDLRDDDKQIALLYYRKACKERRGLTRRLNKLFPRL